MVVIVLSAAPAGLRGALTRWMLEVSAGVYVGHLSTRVREQVWELIQANIGQGRALLVYPVKSEQRFAILSLAMNAFPSMSKGFWSCRLHLFPPQEWKGFPERCRLRRNPGRSPLAGAVIGTPLRGRSGETDLRGRDRQP